MRDGGMRYTVWRYDYGGMEVWRYGEGGMALKTWRYGYVKLKIGRFSSNKIYFDPVFCRESEYDIPKLLDPFPSPHWRRRVKIENGPYVFDKNLF